VLWLELVLVINALCEWGSLNSLSPVMFFYFRQDGGGYETVKVSQCVCEQVLDKREYVTD